MTAKRKPKTPPGVQEHRLVRRPTIVDDASGFLILIAPVAPDRWDKHFLSHGFWIWDDQIEDDSVREWLKSPHYIAPNAEVSDGGPVTPGFK